MSTKLMQQYMLQFVGMKYKWGGDDTILGFDCSGFVQEILAAFGRAPKTDLTAAGLYQHFLLRGDIKKTVDLGYLVFYGDGKIKHVAIGIDRNLVIEAGGGGRMTHSYADAARDNAYIRVRPANSRRDMVSIIDPIF